MLDDRDISKLELIKRKLDRAEWKDSVDTMQSLVREVQNAMAELIDVNKQRDALEEMLEASLQHEIKYVRRPSADEDDDVVIDVLMGDAIVGWLGGEMIRTDRMRWTIGGDHLRCLTPITEDSSLDFLKEEIAEGLARQRRKKWSGVEADHRRWSKQDIKGF